MSDRAYASRAGLKLEHALRAFDVDVTGLICADFGCNVGGFTDCLLRHGAAKVYAIDTAYGELAWKLRNDDRVVVMERTNALHVEPPTPAVCDLISIDLGWTRQDKAIPAALPWLKPGDSGGGMIITLIKPHYEATEDEKNRFMQDGAMTDEGAHNVFDRVIGEMDSRLRAHGERTVTVVATTQSPIRGGKSSRKAKSGGNIEYLALLSVDE